MTNVEDMEYLRQFIRMRFKNVGYSGILKSINEYFRQFSDISLIDKTVTSLIYKVSYNHEKRVVKITTDVTREITVFQLPIGIGLLDYYSHSIFREPKTNNIAFIAYQIEACDCDLKKYVEMNQNLEYKTKLKIIFDIARDISTLHTHGYAHRRIEPKNILLKLDKDEKIESAKLSDFSMLRVLEKQTTATVGQTLICFAPEMLDFEKMEGTQIIYGPKVDIWAIGIIIHWLFTGKFPCDENIRDEIQLRDDLIKFADEIQNLKIPNDIYDQEMLKLVQGCITINQDKRFSHLELLNKVELIISSLDKNSEPEKFDIFYDDPFFF